MLSQWLTGVQMNIVIVQFQSCLSKVPIQCLVQTYSKQHVCGSTVRTCFHLFDSTGGNTTILLLVLASAT